MVTLAKKLTSPKIPSESEDSRDPIAAAAVNTITNAINNKYYL